MLAAAVAAARATLGDRLLAAYALGSLAHGGFSPLVSDVDLGLILADPPEPGDAAAVEAAAGAVRSSGAPLGDRLSVFWGTPSTLRGERPGGRFPPLDRLDLLEHGRLLAGAERPRRPAAPRHRRAGGQRRRVRARRPRRRRRRSADLRSPARVLARGVRPVTKLVLYPPRFLFTAETGRVGTNDASAAHHVAAARPGAAPGRERARLARRPAGRRAGRGGAPGRGAAPAVPVLRRRPRRHGSTRCARSSWRRRSGRGASGSYVECRRPGPAPRRPPSPATATSCSSTYGAPRRRSSGRSARAR